MKRVLLLCLVTLISAHTWAYDFEVDGIYYNVLSGGLSVEVTYAGNTTAYTGDITIPETVAYEGTTYNVVSIGQVAFNSCKGLTSVTIPDGVTLIDMQAFQESGIQSVVFGKKATKISDSAFYDCESLSNVDFGGVETIGDYVFDNCIALTSVNIPNVTTIGIQSFEMCYALESVTLGSNFSKFGETAFCFCNKLTSVTILNPQPPTFVAPFDSCEGNITIHVPAGTIDVYQDECGDNIFKYLGGKGSYAELDYAVIKLELEYDDLGYATYYNADYDITLPSGVTAYTTSEVTVADGQGTLNMEELGETVSAGTPVVVRGALGAYTDVKATKASASSSNSYLHGNSTSTTTTGPDSGDYYFYKLSLEDKVGFFWGNSTGEAFTMAANQAWLAVPQAEVSGLSVLYMDYGDPVYEDIGCTVYPEDGSSLDWIDEITFSKEEGIYFNEDNENGYNGDPIIIYDANDNEVSCITDMDTTKDANGVNVAQIVNFSPVVTAVGEYTVVVPKGFFYTLVDGAPVYSAKITLTYTIEPITYELSFSPENGSAVDSVCEFTVTCEDGLGFNENNPITIARDGETLDVYVLGWKIIDDTYCTFEIYADEWGETEPLSFTDFGTYVITIPAGYFSLGTRKYDSNEIVLTYVIQAPGEYSFSPENGRTLASLSEISVYYTYGIKSSGYYSGNVTVTNEEGTLVANDASCVTTYPENDGEGLYCTITLSDANIVKADTYTVKIPEGYFIIGSSPNYEDSEAITLTYTVSGLLDGIENVNIDPQNATIYTISGQRVSAPSKSGVYIVGGKKILMR